ncbi:hypothetical protein AAVH_01324 [Aphelenchoides avenae]|nr:hypothetical protein AAVH_01324 [Aphelenchus avenae]
MGLAAESTSPIHKRSCLSGNLPILIAALLCFVTIVVTAAAILLHLRVDATTTSVLRDRVDPKENQESGENQDRPDSRVGTDLQEKSTILNHSSRHAYVVQWVRQENRVSLVALGVPAKMDNQGTTEHPDGMDSQGRRGLPDRKGHEASLVRKENKDNQEGRAQRLVEWQDRKEKQVPKVLLDCRERLGQTASLARPDSLESPVRRASLVKTVLMAYQERTEKLEKMLKMRRTAPVHQG